jgi:hypothetical protein
VTLEIGEDAVASLGTQARGGVVQGPLVPCGRLRFLRSHEPIIREP